MRRTLLCAGLLLAGCGERDAAAPDRATPPVQVQAAAAPVAPPAAPVDPIAAAAELYAAAEQPLTIVDGVDVTMPPRYFDVVDCSEEFRSQEPGGETPQVETVARRIALLRRSLRLAGYTPDVIEAPLAHYAAAAAPMDDAASREALPALAAELDAARDRLQPDRLPIRALGECGAAEAPILVHTRPAGGQVWLITQFGFDLCSANRIDPWNRAACTRWSETDPDRPLQLSGHYVYQARWPDGSAARGDRRIDPVDDADAETPQIITVARP